MIPSAEIKRQILTENTTFRKNLQSRLQGIDEGEIIEMGNAFETMVKTKAWTFIEAYLIRRMNITGLLFAEDDNLINKGIARGYAELLQYVDQVIRAKDAILSRENVSKVREDIQEAR